MRLQENIPLAPLTTFGIGGSARCYTEAQSDDDLREAIEWSYKKGLRPVVLGGGSNVLVPDEGLDGLVIRIASSEHSFAGTELAADAGCELLALIREASSKGLGGWEKLAGIPGTIGGAARGNAGAFGTEMKDVLTKVVAMDIETGEQREFLNETCDFSYWHSFFKDHPEWVITRVFVQLQKVVPENSEAEVRVTIAERERRHLQNVKAAGSFFMNPIAPKEVVELFEKEKGVTSRGGRVPAGWLIEKAGMKGATVGDAIASEQHPNYIVNQGQATASDVRALADKVKAAVKAQFEVNLQEEAALI